ncbi:dihydrofolate reductase [Priestia filamentosa]|uniref:dihydrofolate reductase n=1 Tax=Priestia filamentosa TaxID=1402861 RepID=UPI00397A49C9
MNFSIIVATSRNGVIGENNKMPWHLPQDLRYFREKTLGKTVIMGRKTFQSIGKPLPNRKNVVLTRDPTFYIPSVKVYKDLRDIISDLSGNEEYMVIGGGEIYNAFLPYVSRIYLTMIDTEVRGDTEFFVPNDYYLQSEILHTDGAIHGRKNVEYRFRIYEK